jgi:hypothetical protein
MKKVAKKVLKFSEKILTGAALGFLEGVLQTSKDKKHKPTFTELTYGEKMLLSDKYHVDD